MFAALLGLIEALFQARDIKDLLVQERLRTMIEHLQAIGEVHIRTAIEELSAAIDSAQPDKERDRAIGNLLAAANALIMSQNKRPFIRPLFNKNEHRMQTYLRITSCYLLIAGLYRTQHNIELVRMYATKAQDAFQGYADIRQSNISKDLRLRFTHNGSTDQAPFTHIIDCRELRNWMERYNLPGLPNEGTFNALAESVVREEREKLFGWLKSL